MLTRRAAYALANQLLVQELYEGVSKLCSRTCTQPSQSWPARGEESGQRAWEGCTPGGTARRLRACSGGHGSVARVLSLSLEFMAAGCAHTARAQQRLSGTVGALQGAVLFPRFTAAAGCCLCPLQPRLSSAEHRNHCRRLLRTRAQKRLQGPLSTGRGLESSCWTVRLDKYVS